MYIDLDEGRVTNAATLSHELDFIVLGRRLPMGMSLAHTPRDGAIDRNRIVVVLGADHLRSARMACEDEKDIAVLGHVVHNNGV